MGPIPASRGKILIGLSGPVRPAPQTAGPAPLKRSTPCPVVLVCEKPDMAVRNRKCPSSLAFRMQGCIVQSRQDQVNTVKMRSLDRQVQSSSRATGLSHGIRIIGQFTFASWLSRYGY